MAESRLSSLSRLWSWAALALLLAAGVAAAWLVLSNLVWAIAFTLTAVLAIALVWRLLFAPSQASKAFYLVLALVLFALLFLEVLIFLRGNARAVIALAVVAAGAIAITSGLRERAPRRLIRHEGLVASGEVPFLIINPKSGSGRVLKQKIPKLATESGIQVLQLEPGGSLEELIDRAVKAGATQLGISGGDGSLGLAAAASMKHNLPLVVLPGGTRCHFARDIGLDPDNMAGALRAFSGRAMLVDAAELNGRVFLNNASFGIYGDIVSQPGYRERKLQSALKVFEEKADQGYPLSFQDGSGKPRNRALMVLIGVNRYETINLMEIGSRQRLDEGVLQMTALYRLEPELLKTIAKLQLSAHRAGVSQWVAPEFSISSADQLNAGIDGELVQVTSPAHIRILPSALKILVPPDGAHHRRTIASSITNLKDSALGRESPHE